MRLLKRVLKQAAGKSDFSIFYFIFSVWPLLSYVGHLRPSNSKSARNFYKTCERPILITRQAVYKLFALPHPL